MSLCTVANLRSVLGVGALHTDATLQDACTAADEILLPMLGANAAFASYAVLTDNVATLYFTQSIQWQFYVGQTITVSGCGTIYNGTHTITSVGVYGLTFALTHADDPYHGVYPYGSVLAPTTTDYSVDKSIIAAATAIAVDIWQHRNSAGAGAVGLDGNPMPYRLGVSLLSRTRGMIAHALDVRGLVF
jgi:hypothetical protein